MIGKTNRASRRNRRNPAPGTPGGFVAGINVLVFEFRASADTANLSLRQITDTGDQITCPLGYDDDEPLPLDGVFIFNATMPGSPVTPTAIFAQTDGSLNLVFTGLDPSDAGTLVIRPMLPQFTDRLGRVCGGLQATIPPL